MGGGVSVMAARLAARNGAGVNAGAVEGVAVAVDDQVGTHARETGIVNRGDRNAPAPGGRHPAARRRG